MTPLERGRLWAFIRQEIVPSCATCKHFAQHYIYMEHFRRYDRMHQGHCKHWRIKPRKVYDLCDHYERKE